MDKELVFHGVDKLDELGFRGQGVNVLIFEVAESPHADMVEACLAYMAPQARIHRAWFSLRYFKVKEMLTYIIDHDIHIVNISLSAKGYPASFVRLLSDLIDRGLLVFTAGGNGADKGPFGLAMDAGIMVGAAHLSKGGQAVRDKSSAISPYLDVLFLRPPASVAGRGTSFSTPMAAGFAARLLSGYGRIEQNQMLEVFRRLSIKGEGLLKDEADLGPGGEDRGPEDKGLREKKSPRLGWGIPVFRPALMEELLGPMDR